MAIAFTALRHARIAVVLLALSVLASARAEDAPQPQPGATPSGRNPAAGAGYAGCRRATSAATGFDHQTNAGAARAYAQFLGHRGLDPAVRRQGRAQADIAYTAYQLDGADARTRPVTFLFNGGPGASSAWLQFGTAGVVAARHQRRGGVVLRVARPSAQRRDLARFFRSGLHRSCRHRLQPFRCLRRGGAQAVLLGRRRRQFDRADDPPLAEKSDRLLSPKFVAGESYGGIRGPKIVRNLQTRQGIGVGA